MIFNMDHDALEQGVIKLPIYESVVKPGNLINNSHTNNLTVEFKFINVTTEYIVVHFRDGTYAILSPEIDSAKLNSLIIGHSKTFRKGNLNIISGEECELTNTIRSRISATNGKEIIWEENITLDTLKKHKNGIYLASSDVVISLADRIQDMEYHPFCKQYIHNMYLNQLEEFNSKLDFCLGLRLIDNEGCYKRIYVVLHNRIIVLQPRKSNVMKSGVYISGLTEALTEYVNDLRRDEWYSIEDCLLGKAPFKMFKTIIEARELVDDLHALVVEEKRRDKEHEAYIAGIKLEKERLENENHLLKVQQSKNKIVSDELEGYREFFSQVQKDRMEETILQSKEQATINNNEHKAFIEVLKTIGIGLTFVLTVYKLFK